YMTAESVQQAAHAFMKSLMIDAQHNFVEGAGTVVESYIARSTFEIGEHVIKEGSWVLVTEATNEIWEGIKEGKYTGYSMAGTADAIQDPHDRKFKQSYMTDESNLDVLNIDSYKQNG
ncbi:XkdF-like putative serine protease domain-containing protein, partial [Paenibacillus taichungensis]